jgi:hypothetical protein
MQLSNVFKIKYLLINTWLIKHSISKEMLSYLYLFLDKEYVFCTSVYELNILIETLKRK